MAIRRNSDQKGRGKSTGYRRDEKPAGSSSYFKKKDGDERGKSFGRGFAGRGERSSTDRPSSFRGKKEFDDEKPVRKNFEERPSRKSFGDRKESSSDRPSSFREKKGFGDREEKPFRKSFGDRKESSSERPSSFRGKKGFGDREEKPFRKSFGDREERSSERTPTSFRDKRDSGDREEKPFRKSFGDREKRSSERTPTSFRGKKEFNDEKPFRKSFSDRKERSTEGTPSSFRAKKEFYGDNEGKPFKKTYSKKDESSSFEKPSFKNKNDFDDRDERPERKFADEKFSKGSSAGEFTERKNFVKKSFNKKRNQDAKADDGLVRLNKFIANSGICSRREADEFITAGLVSVNGEIVTTLGTKVKLTDDIRYNGTRMKSERMVYVLLNKPKDYITTTDDPQQRKTVMELVASACKERIYPVGRLDRNTTGLLLMTNDGDLADKLTHPSTNIKKTYMVELNKNLKPADMQQIAEGLQLEDGLMKVDEIAFDQAANSKKIIGVTIHSGRNRIVRRIFEHLGYMVVKLDRTYYAGLTKRDLPRGRYRHLDEMEINMLKMVKAR